jgi:multidrug efflux pump subunit AcrA (membrane-fusion protein)
MQRLEELGRRVLVYGEPLWYPAARETLAPELEQALDACLDESHARVFGAIPLVKRLQHAEPGSQTEPIGMLFVEQFQVAAAEPALIGRAIAVGRHATSALANAVDYESLPLLKLERGLLGLRWLTRARQLPKTVLCAAVVLLAALLLTLYPADFSIEARGELQPRTRRDVFAPSDSIVSEIHVGDGREVRAGEVLVTLRRPQLDFDLHRVLGETQTARKRLAGVQAARLGPERGKTDTTQRYNQLTAEEEELKELLASLSEQEQNLRAQQAELSVTSPIDGQVLTWDVAQLLESRPVQRGQVLLAVGDLAGPWQLELRLPDDHAGYVLAAEQTIDPKLDVDFMLATDPGTTYRGHVEKTALAAQTDEVYGSHVLLTVAIDRAAVSGLRPGASVIGKIHCGRRAIGFVWFHDLISTIRRRLLF